MSKKLKKQERLRRSKAAKKGWRTRKHRARARSLAAIKGWETRKKKAQKKKVQPKKTRKFPRHKYPKKLRPATEKEAKGFSFTKTRMTQYRAIEKAQKQLTRIRELALKRGDKKLLDAADLGLQETKKYTRLEGNIDRMITQKAINEAMAKDPEIVHESIKEKLKSNLKSIKGEGKGIITKDYIETFYSELIEYELDEVYDEGDLWEIYKELAA